MAHGSKVPPTGTSPDAPLTTLDANHPEAGDDISPSVSYRAVHSTSTRARKTLRAQNGEIVHRQFVEISVRGEFDPASIDDIDDVTVTADRGTTRLCLDVRDDSVLYGLLLRLQSTDLEVLAVVPRDRFGDKRGEEIPADPGS